MCRVTAYGVLDVHIFFKNNLETEKNSQARLPRPNPAPGVVEAAVLRWRFIALFVLTAAFGVSILMVTPLARLSLRVQYQSNTDGWNVEIVYENERFPMPPNPAPGVVEAAVPRWSPDALWVLMAPVGIFILLVVQLVLNAIHY